MSCPESLFNLTGETSKNMICPSIHDDIVIAGQRGQNKTIDMKHLEVEPSFFIRDRETLYFFGKSNKSFNIFNINQKKRKGKDIPFYCNSSEQ
jgi:hypothetical protein